MITKNLSGFSVFHTNNKDGTVRSWQDFLDKFPNQFPNQFLVEAKQTHSTNVQIVNNLNNQIIKLEDTDGLITDQKDVVLLIKTADCIPVVFYDAKNHIIANVHIGWRGLVGGIFENTLEKLIQNFAIKTQDLQLYIGPSIRGCCYCFDTPPQQIDDPSWQNYLNQINDKWCIDLVGFLKNKIAKYHINKVIDSNTCTYHQDNFPSHLRSKHQNAPTGSFATIVQLTHKA